MNDGSVHKTKCNKMYASIFFQALFSVTEQFDKKMEVRLIDVPWLSNSASGSRDLMHSDVSIDNDEI